MCMYDNSLLGSYDQSVLFFEPITACLVIFETNASTPHTHRQTNTQAHIHTNITMYIHPFLHTYTIHILLGPFRCIPSFPDIYRASL